MKTSSSNHKDPTSHCFSTMLQHFVCAKNLPTHPPTSKIPEKSNKIPTFSRPPNDINNDSNILAKSQVQNQPQEIPDKPNKVTTFSYLLQKSEPNITVQSQVQAQAKTEASPGIVARLMGLDSLPTNNNDSLFRSKSLNSLHFLPDFDPTRASFHRRARTSASFHEQGHNSNFLFTINEKEEPNALKKTKEKEKGHRDLKQRKEEKQRVAILKANERRIKSRKIERKKRYEDGYASSTSSNSTSSSNLRGKYAMQRRKLVTNSKEVRKVNNVVGPSKKRVDQYEYKEDHQSVELQSDGMSRSPVSVLDHHLEFDSPLKEDTRHEVTSSSRRNISKPKMIKLYDEMPPQDISTITKTKKNNQGLSNKIGSKDNKSIKKLEGDVSEYFVELMGQICKLAEEQLTDAKWMTNYEGCKVHFVDQLCIHFGEELMDILLNELMVELVE